MLITWLARHAAAQLGVLPRTKNLVPCPAASSSEAPRGFFLRGAASKSYGVVVMTSAAVTMVAQASPATIPKS